MIQGDKLGDCEQIILTGTTVINAFDVGPSSERRHLVSEEDRNLFIFAEKKLHFGGCVLDENDDEERLDWRHDDSFVNSQNLPDDSDQRDVSELEVLVNALELNKDEDDVKEDNDSRAGQEIIQQLKAQGNWPPFKEFRDNWKDVLREESRYAKNLTPKDAEKILELLERQLHSSLKEGET
mmetsp:Transcript_21634/g.28009  ORF Transcript_21634/g.28009 Transcript_21634/m.28009 type:complete len:181 (-) Transcript_21634:153-695(-)|eukprot:CAMPEP_0197292724 /NCGR_PEP_ID=MMETSP0890-20130614/24724_1 /TAXON_ID=44058 ORGANISM="Aureoumbra lagunensis, Strain CCMP1510" /NCGR_SAMPLE_ID=MMETSP0890 /ASSEMBLY_ACC=CAM_ASM_000533 /LENGTH=180 /DNA_ID=CAMNT_0042766857 /DNA_START=119 /DNA_END=661 /DNA_ORIENTATION=-